jgi:DNA polymerase (family 10)
MDKNSIARVLGEIAVLLELSGENAFKIRAYQSGARAVESLEEDLGLLIGEGRLTDTPGIGKALSEKIAVLYQSGELEYHADLKAAVPAGLLEMMEIPGMGAKKIRAVHEALGIESIDELELACREEQVANLPGFGRKSEEKILIGIRNREAYGKRHLWWDAQNTAEPILEGLRNLPGVERAESAGSLRRGVETVGDLDFIAASAVPGPIMDWFTGLPNVAEVTAKGETKSSIRLESGMQADLRVVPAEQFHFALHHFTGSKDHNVMMRQRALQRGLSLSEWGITPVASEGGSGGESGSEDRVRIESVSSEEALFDLLGLAYIPPELREGGGEIAAAESGGIPQLLVAADLKGVFHNHTIASDGHNTLEEMAQEAEDIGWEYLGIADHSKASFQANGLDEERVAKQLSEIRAINASGTFAVHLFAGVECDILPDGRLDLDESILSELDYVVVSVHSSFQQGEGEMTSRIIRALESPHTTILGHLTGRLLLRREGYAVDVNKVVDAAAANGKVIEINAHPVRLDMDWRHWRRAVERGVICAINPDAHSREGLHYARAGVLVARKGWLRKGDLLNTRTRREVEEFFER